jgi:hypothetical protein
MSSTFPEWTVGQRVSHPEMDPGVFITGEPGGYARVFFQQVGERRVPVTSLRLAISWEEQVVAQVRPAKRDAVQRLWLALEAEQLPLMENAATLTAAKVDLLPHQIVLTYRLRETRKRQPRSFPSLCPPSDGGSWTFWA